MDNKILFSESQKFKQCWLWMLLIAVNLFTFSGVYQQVINGHPFGDKPTSNTELISGACITLLIAILLLIIRLDLEIKRDGVYVRFFPLHLKFRYYPWSQLSKCYVRKYRPMGEFGGWGLRIEFSGKAYNISGNQGLQLEFTNNKRLLIGTQKPEELTEALNKIGKLIQ
jgi:uncharacterized protein DUF6141